MKHLGWVLACIICLILGGVLVVVTPLNVLFANPITTKVQNRQPLIFVPGSSGTQDTYDGMLKKLNQGTKKHSILKITIKNNGQWQSNGRIIKNDRQPLIVVAFENNQDGDDNIAAETKLFKTAIRQLERRYAFQTFRGVGYSNGGLVLTQFAEQAANRADLKRLLTIGAPFNGLNQRADDQSPMLKSLLAKRQQLPPTLTVFSVGNAVKADDDGVVPMESINAGRQIFMNQVAHFTTFMLNDPQAEHAALIDNQKIIKFVAETMLKAQTPI